MFPGLEADTSPYVVYFSRKPHWRSVAVAEYIPLIERDEEIDERNRIERRLLAYKKAAHEALVAKSKQKNVTVFAP